MAYVSSELGALSVWYGLVGRAMGVERFWVFGQGECDDVTGMKIVT